MPPRNARPLANGFDPAPESSWFLSGKHSINLQINEEVSVFASSYWHVSRRYNRVHLLMDGPRMILLTRKAEFSASHYYWSDQLSPEENQRVFGKCANRNGHGHNYTLEVTVEGEVDPVTGFVVDLKELKDIMHREVVDVYDHRHLNLEVPEFAKLIPTTENISISIWKRLEHKIGGAKLHRVRVFETPELFSDYYGEA